MRFLADAGISPKTVEFLRRNGHDAVHLRELAMQRAADPLIADKARAKELSPSTAVSKRFSLRKPTHFDRVRWSLSKTRTTGSAGCRSDEMSAHACTEDRFVEQPAIALFEHVYESYLGEGRSAYTEAA